MTDFQKFKNKNRIGIIVGAVLLAVGLVVCLLGGGILGIVLALFGALALYGTLWTLFEHRNTFCVCGHRFDYETEVAYEEVDKYITPDRKKEITRIEFECSCGECGEEKTFVKKFTSASIDKNGREVRTNVSREIKKLFVYKI